MIKAIRQAVLPLSLALGLLVPAPLEAQQTAPNAFDSAQEQAIRDVVRDYLIAHPEVLIEALTKYQEQQKLAAEERRRESLTALRGDLTEDPDSPVLGNPKGDVVVVEFFDYRCPYCRTVAKPLLEAITSDGNVRLAMKEFPILGPESVTAARAALAAARQGRYEEFHFALMATKGQINEATVMSVARQVDLDIDKLKSDMDSAEISAMLDRNMRLAEALDIGGTPAFVIGDELVPGAIELEQLELKIAEARAKSN